MNTITGLKNLPGS